MGLLGRSVWCVLLTWGLSACRTEALRPAPEPARLVLIHGRIFTGVPGAPFAEALAVRGDQLVAVGSHAEIQAYVGAGTEVVDAEGRLVVPGLNDAHLHVGPEVGESVEPEGGRDPTLPALLAAVSRRAAAAPPGTWLVGRYGPRIRGQIREVRALLDQVAPTVPVTLIAGSGHGYVWNSAALKEIGLPREAVDPPGGWYERAGDTLLMAHEYAGWRGALTRLSRASQDESLAALAQTEAAALGFGITSLQAFSFKLTEDAALLPRIEPRARWRLMDFTVTQVLDRLPLPPSPHPRVELSGYKTVLDGTPVERDAWLSRDYPSEPGWRGRPNFTDEQLRYLLDARRGQQPILHVVGDAMIERVLDLMEATAPAERWRARRVRFEHADFITPAQLERAAKLGVVLCQNPIHFQDRAALAPDPSAQRLASVLRAGVPLCLGSDGPLNPWLGIMLAVRHPNNPAEAITLEQALSAYTWGAAWAQGEESRKGRLTPGRLADFVVLSQDIFTVPIEALPGTRAVRAFVGGEAVSPRVEKP